MFRFALQVLGSKRHALGLYCWLLSAAVVSLAANAAFAQEKPALEETPLERILSLLRDPNGAREKLPDLEARFNAAPSFLLGAEWIAALEAVRDGARVLEVLPLVLAEPHNFDGENGVLVLDAAGMVRAFGANEYLNRARTAEERLAWSDALRDVARGEACLAGLQVPAGEILLPLVEGNALQVRSALLQLEVSLLFGCGGHRLATSALRERESVLRRQLELMVPDDDARRRSIYEKLAECAALRAEIERVDGQHDRAEDILGESRSLLQTLTAPSADTLAMVSEIAGLVAEDRGDVALATESYEMQLRALDSLGERAMPGEKADALRGLGDLARRRGDGSAALAYYDRASQEVAGAGDALRFRHEVQLAYRRSLCYAKEARGPEAQAELQRCLDLLEALHRSAPQLHSGGVFGLRETRRVAEEWLRQHLQHGEPDHHAKGLSALERVRARGILGAIDAPAAREVSTARGDQRVTALRTAALFGSASEAAGVREELAIAVAKLERARAAALRPGAGYRAHWFEEIQALLRAEDGRALVYFLGDDGLWIWLLDGKEARHRRVAIGKAAFENELRALQRALATPPASGQGAERLGPALAELRSTLLPEAFLRDLRGSLTIVPDGLLHLFPWSLLVLDRVQSLRVVPSLHARLEWHAREPNATAVDASHAAALLIGVAQSDDQRRAPLATREALALARLYGDRAQVLLETAATPAEVQRNLQVTPSMAHFAVHGVVDPLFPSSSGLALSGGYLWPEDVLALRQVPELVVLNACSSGAGERSGSEGVIGVARAFLERGANSVVATLWDVDDAAALIFAERFHGRIAAGDRPSYALLDAQRAVRERFPDPSAWGAFTLLGDGSSAASALTTGAETLSSSFRVYALAFLLIAIGACLAWRALRPRTGASSEG